MQVFWVSGPVGKIRSFNLTLKAVVVGMGLLALGLLATGSLLQFLGFRLALEYDPQIARRLGNLHTAVELENLNALYHARLGELQTEQQRLAQQLSELAQARGKLAELLPSGLARELPLPGAQGGAYLPSPLPSPLPTEPEPASSVLARMGHLHQAQQHQREAFGHEARVWRETTAWLEGLPLGLPVAGRPTLTSGYGVRADPLTGRPALHSGLDFDVPAGTPILAAGSGQVIEAGWDGQYGHTVVVRHHTGYSSRYAHASQLKVAVGDRVTRGQWLALSGNSGRSTGPHLHFEVLRGGHPIDPTPYLLALGPNAEPRPPRPRLAFDGGHLLAAGGMRNQACSCRRSVSRSSGLSASGSVGVRA